jgi:H+-translocating NAD(P) transhydrogenase subunit alpha
MIRVGVLREHSPGERRIAVTPEVVARLGEMDAAASVEEGAGSAAGYTDSMYRDAGAQVQPLAAVCEGSDVIVAVGPPWPARLRRGQVVIGLLAPESNLATMTGYALCGVTALSLDRLPRNLSRAQAMDALTSQAAIAGYKAAIVAAYAYGRYLPMMMTAAGTIRPSSALVLGAGVAGLAAIGTLRRLGAVVTGYDLRPEAVEEIRSLGARVLDLGAVAPGGEGQGGYAQELADTERAAQQLALQQKIGDFDIVITTAQVPGRTPPLLVTEQALKGMRHGSVVVDVARGPAGGNVEGSRVDERFTTEDGVIVIGAGNLPSQMAPAASAAYARNIAAVLEHVIHDGQLVIDDTDEITRALLIVRDGRIVTPLGARP